MAAPLLVINIGKALLARRRRKQQIAETIDEVFNKQIPAAVASLQVTGEVRLEEWRGNELYERIMRAVEAGVEDTLQACVDMAQTDHGWESQTGTAEESIQIGQIVRDGATVRGEWGSYGGDAHYFVWLETGSSSIEADDTLRRAADAIYPELAARIRAHLS